MCVFVCACVCAFVCVRARARVCVCVYQVCAGLLQAIGLKDGWYQLCQNREARFASCRDGVNEVVSYRKHNTCTANRQLQDGHFDCGLLQEF